MRSNAVLLAIAGVGIAGCAGLPPDGGTGGSTLANCDGHGACKVRVSVTNCVITPDPETLPVTGKNILIFWELDLGSMLYRFPDDGIKLKTPSTEFDEPEAQAHGKKFKLHDKNSLTGEHRYEYAIKVQRLVMFNWVDCQPLDPWVVNR